MHNPFVFIKFTEKQTNPEQNAEIEKFVLKENGEYEYAQSNPNLIKMLHSF